MLSKAVYIKSSNWKPQYEQDPELRRAKKGYLFVQNNQLFYRNRVLKIHINWVCKERIQLPGLCSCSINIAADDSIIKINGEHNHDPLSELEIKVNKFNRAIKENPLSDDLLCSEIYNQERKKSSERTGSETSCTLHSII